MVTIEDTIVVNAPAAVVWRAIADPAAHASWHPFVTGIRGEHALGASRSCSVIVGRKRGETTERCVEHDEPQRIAWLIEADSTGFSRMVSDWRSGFSLEQRDGATLVTAHSAFEPRRLLLRVMQPFVRRKFHQTQRAILAGLKVAVEADARVIS
jgi:uncharacterized protein YndB with AHSA1/START domain